MKLKGLMNHLASRNGARAFKGVNPGCSIALKRKRCSKLVSVIFVTLFLKVAIFERGWKLIVDDRYRLIDLSLD